MKISSKQNFGGKIITTTPGIAEKQLGVKSDEWNPLKQKAIGFYGMREMIKNNGSDKKEYF